MPHIRIRAMSESEVKNLSKKLPVELAKILKITEDSFTVERVETVFYKDGAVTQGDPMIEILWFDRGSELKEACALKTTEIARELSKAEFLAVVFTALPKDSYFENGKHF
jgi:hypothetical protein